MNRGFWENLKKPIMALAPMADVTDPPYRAIIAKLGKPDILFTEFVSCDGLCSLGRNRILKDLKYSEAERPIVGQIFGANPKNMYQCATLLRELGFDGVDINMGCPDKTIERQGAGAALIKNPKLAYEIITAVKDGARELPVSVKTRIGYNKNEIEEWLPVLLSAEPVAITFHLRTRKEMSKVPAHWDVAKRAVEIRDTIGKNVLILGNGDLEERRDAEKKVRETGVDGIMFGRAIFGNPWFFSKEVDKRNIPLSKILATIAEHAALYEKLMGGVKSFAVMKKHFKAYVHGFPGAGDIRIALMNAGNADDVYRIVRELNKSIVLHAPHVA